MISLGVGGIRDNINYRSLDILLILIILIIVINTSICAFYISMCVETADMNNGDD